MSTLDIDMSKVPLPTGVDAVEQLKALINALRPTCYHPGVWQLDEANCTLTRVHKGPRQHYSHLNVMTVLFQLKDWMDKELLPYTMVKEMFGKFRTTSSLQDYQICWWIHTGKEGLCFNWRLCPLVGTTPRHLLKPLLCLGKNLNLPRRNHLLHRTLSRTHKGHLISALIVDGHWIRKWWPFVTLITLELFNTPEAETGELRTSDCWIHTPSTDQDGKSFVDQWNGTLTQDGKSFVDQWNGTHESRDVGFAWTGLTLFQTSDCTPDTIVEQETHDKAKALPRPTSNEQHATSHTYHLGHGANTVWSPTVLKITQNVKLTDSPSFKLNYCFVNTGLTLDNGQFSLLWMFRLDLLLLLWFQI